MKEKIPTIKCECGYEIMLVPDLKVMNKAIESHVAEHVKKQPDKAKAEREAKRIGELLIEQVLKKAAQTE